MKPLLCSLPGAVARGRARRITPSFRARHANGRVRGAAYVEAILLILFMIIIFGGVLYLGRYFEAQQRALGVARRCAWEFSWNACIKDPDCGKGGNHRECLPAVCDGVFGDGPKDEPNSEIEANINAARQSAQTSNGNTINDTGKDAGRKQDLRNGVTDELRPFYEMIVGQYVTAEARSEIARPASLPDAESSIGASFYLPCNLKHEDPLPVAIRLFTKLLGGPL